jgi:drug/metabolite transporter (DMT)-like permease
VRFPLQCIAAALASLAVPVAGALWILASDPVANGSIDDAPHRAAMLFLVAVPGLLLFLAIYFGVSSALLRHVADVSLVRLFLVNLGVSLLVAIPFTLQGYTEFGARDAAISFGAFGALSFVSLSLGSTAWWLLRPASAPRS